ncbi:serine/threonine-protein kinase [Leifsonia virtsii]|uniref:non-specific serine/threonine protein kinase n=1 Tax=Leifsonia virtsii TaxID=3035915 RepID=A0ABT8IZ13_9MICO|nr:serine/threonine-protein kinase [Leifsonia virtsii]MDN4598044.1 serine/threonine-protein kinase [Leifsonia virtsii]
MSAEEIVVAATAAAGVTDVQPLTQGGQKLVFSARLAGNPVVLKVVMIQAGPTAEVAVERAHREVELLAAVDSPHVVSVLSDAIEIGDSPDAVVWIEERLDGHDLPQLVPPLLDDVQIVDFLVQTARGLKACHDLAVVHRDLSPANVRRKANGTYVLMDPGLARHIERTAITGDFQPGTNGFRSPEHVWGGEPTPASDIFCLGILAFFLRTGHLPVDPRGTQGEYDRRLRIEQAPSILSVDSSIDPGVAHVIDTCLLRQAARRYLDGSELLVALEELTKGHTS